MKRKLVTILTALALCLSLLPGAAFAAGRAAAYFQIAGHSISGANPDVLGDGTVSVKYEQSGEVDKWTICLRNAHLEDQIRLNSGLVDLILEGANTITVENDDGIDLTGSLTIKGTGSLTVNSSGSAIGVSAISSPAQYDGSVKIESVSDLNLKGGTLGINAVGDVEVTGSKVIVSNNDAFNPAIKAGRYLRISNSEAEVSGAKNDAISASKDITIENSTVTADSPSGNGLYTFGAMIIMDHSTVTSTANALGLSGNQGIAISGSTVEVHSSVSNALYTEADITISGSSVVNAHAQSDWPGIYTPDTLTITGSEVTAFSQGSNALNVGYDLTISDGSTVKAETSGEYPAVYTAEIITVSGSALTANASGQGYGVWTPYEMVVNGASAVTVNSCWDGLYIAGGLTVSGGRVSTISENAAGLSGMLSIEGGEFHAEGTPAVGAFVTDFYNDWGPDPRIELATDLAEISGGKIAMTDWYAVSGQDDEPLWQYATSFIAAEAATLESNLSNALHTVTIRAPGADYSAVDAALAKVPADLSKYTDGTVAALRSAVAAVERGLSRADQPRVDGFAEAIEAAIAGLREKPSTTPDTPDTPDIPGNPGGESSSGSGSGSGGGSQTSLPVNTTGQNSAAVTTTTTAAPTASTKDGAATATVNTAVGNEIVKQAVANNSETVVIAPKVTGDVSKTEVSIPASTVEKIGSQTSASLTVSTPVADVTIPNGGLGSLASAGGTVTVTAEQTGNRVELTVAAGGKTVESVSGGVTLTVPAASTTPGTVAVLVHEDGTREVVRKSVAADGTVTIPLHGSARLEIVDNSQPFADVPGDSWAADAVAFASAHELFNGTAPGQFSPDAPMSRGMLAVVFHNLEGNPAQTLTGAFEDVSGSQWYAEGVAWAAAQGIIGGYGNGLFGPDDPITREQLAVMLWRYAGSPAATEKELRFSDAGKASAWAQDALCWAVENGIMGGKGGGILDPAGLATRAEAAQILINFMERR